MAGLGEGLNGHEIGGQRGEGVQSQCSPCQICTPKCVVFLRNRR